MWVPRRCPRAQALTELHPQEVPTCPGPHSCLPQVQTRKEEPLPPAASRSIPTFYFPRGRPQDTVNIDAVITKIERTFAQFPHERATIEDMGRVAKVGVPVGTWGVLLQAWAGPGLGFCVRCLPSLEPEAQRTC